MSARGRRQCRSVPLGHGTKNPSLLVLGSACGDQHDQSHGAMIPANSDFESAAGIGAIARFLSPNLGSGFVIGP